MEDVRLSSSSPKRIWVKYGDGRPVSIMLDGGIVDDLIEAIKKKLPNRLGAFDTDLITLRKHGEEEDLRADLTVDENFVNNYDTPLQIIVNAPALNKRKSEETSAHEQYMENLKRIKKSPSEMARKFDNKDQLFWKHRPPSAQDIPTELLHPVFGRFLDDCATIQPEFQDVQFTYEFSAEMSGYFRTEGARAASFRDLFKRHFDIDLPCVELSASVYKNNKPRTDGTLYEGKFMMMNAEVKLELCTGTSDPCIQNIAYYKEYILKNRIIAETNRLPCFLVVVSGPLFSISTAVYGEKVTVDPYPYVLSLDCSSYHCVDLARVFCALRNALEALRAYYITTPLPHIEPDQRPFPYINSFLTDDEVFVRFKYQTSLHPLVFVVRVEDALKNFPEYVVVKFTRRYDKNTHQVFAELKIAPQLYGFEHLSGGWKMVVMAFVGDDFKTLAECKKNQCIKQAVEEMAMKMHGEGLVHGDLRDLNILCRYNDNDNSADIFFVDLDWAGQEGTVQYPLDINPDITRHHEATAGSLIHKEHDLYSLQEIFKNL